MKSTYKNNYLNHSKIFILCLVAIFVFFYSYGVKAENEVVQIIMMKNSFVGEDIDVSIQVEIEEPIQTLSYVIKYNNLEYNGNTSGIIEETLSLENNSNTFVKTFSMKAATVGEGTVEIKSISINGNSQLVTLPVAQVCTIQESVSNNADVSDIQVSPMDINFDPNVKTYTIEVEENIEKILVKVIPEDINATYVVTGISNLVVGENHVLVKVTAPDAKTINEYTIIVNKKGETTVDNSSEEVTSSLQETESNTSVEQNSFVESSNNSQIESTTIPSSQSNIKETVGNNIVGKILKVGALCIVIVIIISIILIKGKKKKKKRKKLVRQQSYKKKVEYDNKSDYHPTIIKKEETLLDDNIEALEEDNDHKENNNNSSEKIQKKDSDDDFEIIDVDNNKK